VFNQEIFIMFAASHNKAFDFSRGLFTVLPVKKSLQPTIRYTPENVCLDDFDAMRGAYERNLERLQACDRLAEARGILVGRYFREIVEDGFAYYVIIEDFGDRVRVELAQGLGTDTPTPYYGNSCVILRNLALSRIRWRHWPWP
jgi:hypothetical protein